MKDHDVNRHPGPWRVMQVDAEFAGLIVAVGFLVMGLVSILSLHGSCSDVSRSCFIGFDDLSVRLSRVPERWLMTCTTATRRCKAMDWCIVDIFPPFLAEYYDCLKNQRAQSILLPCAA